MKYSDIVFDDAFVGNMRQTPWTKLFPRWYMEDDFLKAIGDEIELIKSRSLFKLLNVGVKPPVMLWKTSLSHKKYTITKTLNNFEEPIKTRAPLYKTYGTITLKNNGDGISDLHAFLNDSDGIIIKNYIPTGSTLEIDLETQEYLIDGKPAQIIKQGQGLPYFITSRNNETYQEDTPLHNEALILSFFSPSLTDEKINIDAEIILKNVVFENEQNIEVTSLELLPIEKIVLFAEYDFPQNKQYNGIKKVYVKEYDPDTTVVYDMITTQFFTEKFYVEVYFKDIMHPYTVGFPAYKDAPLDSMYHVNTELDAIGDLLELQRREYRTNISEDDYPFTYPEFYPYDIEQDYWYYQRLVNEYAWNDLAIDRADIKDTEDNTVIRLHSTNPFIEDFVVYANSTYPEDIEGINYNEYLPSFVYQETEYNKNTQMPYQDVQNLLRKNDDFAYVNLYNKSDNYITYEGYMSKELGLYYDLSNIPENVNIDGIEIIIDTESTDSSIEKYNDNRTRLQIANNKILPGFIEESGHYELRRKKIVYGDKNTLFGLERIPQTNNYVEQKIVIGSFSAKSEERFKIPFAYYEDYTLDYPIRDPETGELIEEGDSTVDIDEDDELIDTIKDVMIFFYNNNEECIKSTTAEYHSAINDDGTKNRYLLVETFPSEEVATMHIISTEGNKHAFNIELPVVSHTNSDGKVMATVEGQYIHPEGYEGDLSYLLRNYGLYFIYALSNDSKTNSSSVLIHNILLRIYYSPKKEKIQLETKFERNVNKDNPCNMVLGDFYVTVTNIGEKPCEAYVDIIYPDNLILSTNCLETGRLEPGSKIYTDEPIKVSYNQGEFCNAPIDGTYDIITICNGEENIDTITVESLGQLYTSTSIESQICFIESEAILTATVTDINEDIVNDGTIEFRINGYIIEDKYNKTSDILVKDGKASITFIPNDYEFIKPGANDIEVIYSGTTLRNMSRGYATLWVNRNKTRIYLEIPDTLVQKFESEATIRVTYITEQGEELPMQEGNVSLFIEDEEMFTSALVNGSTTVSFQPAYNVGDVTAKAIFGGTDTFPKAEVTKEVKIIGGDAKIETPDITARPDQKITIESYIYDLYGNEMPYGFIDYTIKDEDEIIYEYKNAIVYAGRAAHSYKIPLDAISLNDEDDEKEYQLIASYHDDIDAEIQTSSYSKILVYREEARIIYHGTNFRYSHREPLGFYIEVINAKTGNPIDDGTVTISIPSLGILLEEEVQNGAVRPICAPMEVSAKQWDELFNTSFSFEDSPLYEQVSDKIKAQYKDSNLHFNNNFYELLNTRIGQEVYDNDKAPERIDFKIDEYGHLWFINTEAEDMSYIYLKEDSHLFIKTSDDLKRYFDTGTHNVYINYQSNYQYKEDSFKSEIVITNSEVNVDVHKQELEYGNTYTQITAFVTAYEEQLENDPNVEWINTGRVNYYIDGKLLCNSAVTQGISLVPTKEILKIPYGEHILMAEYVGNEMTYTYTSVQVKKVQSTMNPDKYAPEYFNRVFPGKQSKISLKINANVTFNITGHINVYLNDTQVGYTYLTGDEEGHASLKIDIPKDMTTMSYKYRIEYSGDDRIEGCSFENDLLPTKLPVRIEGDVGPIYATPGTECELSFKISADINDEVDDITQGRIELIPINNERGMGCDVINNIATINLKVPDTIQEEPYQYYLKYVKGVNYEDKTLLFEVYVIDGYDVVYVDGTNVSGHALNIKNGMWIVKDNGTIKLSSWEIDKSGLLNNSFTITKDVTIAGNIEHIEGNPEDYAQNVPPYIESKLEEIVSIHPKIYDRDDFTEDELKSLRIVNIKNSQINTNDFRFIDDELYYVQDNSELMPIYLFDNGLYYAKQEIKLKDIILDINKHNVIFKDIEFRNANTYNKFIIKNDGKLAIKHCIIRKGVEVRSPSELICNENLIYGDINPNKIYNIDNNWWGQNKSPLPTNNNIILKIEAKENPPVVGEFIDIKMQLIGENGVHYTLPQVPFKIYADTGNIHISSGYLVDSQITTGYDDAINEGEIYGEIDNEKVSMTIYDYDRKTETILKSPKTVPIGYQIVLKAIVQSCADKFYKFDKYNNIISQSNDINNGYVTFYINDKKIGKTQVKNGKAELPFYSSASTYNNNDELNIKAIYEPEEYYFTSKTESNIKFIEDNDNVIFVSSSASENGNGTYATPYQSISDALDNIESVPNPTETYYIYIKGGQYYDTNLDISGYNIELIRYDDEVVFKGIEDIICTINNASLTIKGIDFIYNPAPYLIRNNGILNIEDCIFYEDNTIVSNHFENSTPKGETTITKCAIVNTQNIVTDYNNSFITTKCWFGVNEPNTELNFRQINNGERYILNDYILMDLKASKDIIYIGTVAHIIASLNKHYQNGIIYDYYDTLPLRIAFFTTSFGSLMPLKDYTHNNIAISFLNTTDNVNSEKIIISAEDNTNYYNTPLKLQASVYTSMDEPIESGNIIFNIKQKGEQIIPSQQVQISNGLAELIYDDDKLEIGEYILECVYTTETETYQTSFKFDVKLPSLSFENVIIDNTDHLYNLKFESDVISQLGTPVTNVNVVCYIDNKYIKQETIKDGRLLLDLIYTPILAGNHTLKIETTSLNKYQPKIVIYDFISKEKNTYIQFTTTGLGQGDNKNLTAYVYDDNNKLLNYGTLTVSIDGIIKDEHKNIQLYNGKGIIELREPLSNGQHSIIITYSGVSQKYKNAIFVKNDFYVGMYPIVIPNITTFTTEVGTRLNIELPTIIDSFDNPVNKGIMYFDVDDICLNEGSPAQIANGSLSYILDTRRINIGTHDFTIRYYDDSHTYANTTLQLTLLITKIETIIDIDTIIATPDITKNIDYSVTTSYNAATNGVLRAFLDNIEIGTEIVTGTSKKQMQLSIPYIQTGDYTLLFKYHDNEAIYNDSQKQVHLSIDRGDVKISTPYTTYYPNETFRLDIEVNDIEDKPIDTGLLDIYIDGVLEYNDVLVQLGNASVLLTLTQVKNYEISILYKQNDYYKETLYKQNINTNKINIDDINIVEELSGHVGQDKIYHLKFDTLNDHNIEDGIVDFIFNGNLVSSQYVQESQTNDAKEFKITLPNIPQGQHVLTLKYHDSTMFNDKIKTFDFEIVPDIIELSVDDIVAELNNTINITARLDTQTDGLLKFYIGPNEESVQLIAVEEVNNRTEISIPYKIPMLYNDNILKIKAEFRENVKYEDKDAWGTLTINPIDTELSIANIDAYYQDSIVFEATTNILGSEVINFYINDTYIGQGVTTDNGDATLSYKLGKSYKAGVYQIKAIYEGSKVINSAQAEGELIINKYTPTLQTKEYDVYIGDKLELDNIVVGNRGITVLEGELVKTIDNEIIPNTIINKPTSITLNQKEDFNINVEFTPITNNEFNSFNETVNVNMMKNPVNIRILTIPPAIRGDTINIYIKMNSYTTPLPVNLIALINEEEVEITNGEGIYVYTLPILESEDNKFTLPIDIKENDTFIRSENTITEFDVSYKNRSEIYITMEGSDDNIGTEDSPVATLRKALDLVSNNGNIYLRKNIVMNNTFVINKTITINGNNEGNKSEIYVSEGIKTNSKINFLNISFDNTSIECNDEINIDKCEFNNSPITFNEKFNITNSNLHDCNSSAITINNKNNAGNIQYCEIYNNNAVNGAGIYANKGNNLIIEYNAFYNNTTTTHGASLYLNGDTLVRQNTFYNNIGNDDIYVIAGTIESELNLFDNNTRYNIVTYLGYITANMTYWGYNDIENAENSNKCVGENNLILIESWLESDYHISPEPPFDDALTYVVTPFIRKYRANKDDQENIYTIEPIEWTGNYPVTINGEVTSLNNSLETQLIDGQIIVKIGQEELSEA